MSLFQRAPRPMILWAAVVLVIGVTIFILVVLAALAVGVWMTAGQGHEPINLINTLGVIATGVASIGPFIWQVLTARHTERLDQQARGLPPSGVPFPQSPPQISPAPNEPLGNQSGLDNPGTL